MTLKKGDFIEIEFTGKTKEGNIFDSNIKEDLEKANLNGSSENFIFPVGEGMFIKGVDDFLIGKEVGKYEILVEPENAFGKRDAKLIQMMPMNLFIKHKINPIPGIMLNFDGRLAKILTVSGGRVMVDFNHPIAGKQVEYKIIIKRLVEDINEKINAMNKFFFQNKFEYVLNGNKLIIKAPKEFEQFVLMFKEKYKELLKLDLEVEEIKKKD